jgi:hypothetical protein
VASIRAALIAAFDAGRKAGKAASKKDNDLYKNDPRKGA